MNFVDALDELIAIGKLYSESVKKPFSKLDQQALVRFREQLSQKQKEAGDRADKLLGEYKDEDSRVLIQQITQDIQKNYNILDSNTPRLIEYPRHNDANYWGEHYNHSRYECLMSYCKLAYLEELNGIQEEHALKLSLLFNSPLDALMYIKGNSKSNATEKAVHDALLFVLPNPSECTFSFWKDKFKTAIKDKSFIDLLANAPAIEDEIKQNKNEPEKKPDYDLISRKKSQIQKANATFKKLKSRHGSLSDDEKNEYDGLTEKLPVLQLELFHLSAGMPLSQCDAAILKAADESFKKKTEGAYTFMLKHGLTKNDFGKFIALKRQDDEHHIPDIQINGSKLGYEGVYLKKVNVLDEMEAAEAACFGKLTRCCQSLSGEAGEPCVIHGLTSPYGGFYVVKDERGHVLGQCWAWRSQSGAIVFDSIEISGEHDAGTVTALFNQLAQEMVEDGYTRKVACGGSSGISRKFGVLVPNFFEHFVDYNSYCDSKTQMVIVDTSRPYLFLSTNDESRGKAKRFINSVLTTGNLEQSEPFLEMINFMILADNNDLEIEIKEASKLKGVDEQVTEIINNVRIFIDSSPNEKIALLDKKIDKEPYLAKLSDRNNLTPLMLAVDMVRSDLALKLIERGVNVNEKDSGGIAVLILAIRKGLSELALKLIEKGANLHEKDYCETTALILAIEDRNIEIALKLLEKGANPNDKDRHGRTALMIAELKYLVKPIYKLIEKGANIHEKDDQGMTALMYAAIHNYKVLSGVLIEKGAKVDEKDFKGRTALMIAAEKGYSDLALNLIEKGANLHEKDSDGRTALMYATERGYSDLADLMRVKVEKMSDKPQAEIKNPLTPMRDRLFKEESSSQLNETIDGIKEEFRNKP